MTSLFSVGRARRARRRIVANIVLALAVSVLFALSLMIGRTFYPPEQILALLSGQPSGGAAFTIGQLRLPRALAAVMAGVAFGMAGATFQTVLRNPLASPDIIGISGGASAAAVVGIIVLGWSGPALTLLALAGAVATAAVIALLARRGGFSRTRLVLIGIGVAAMLQSVVTYLISRAATWDLQASMRWLTGSLNGVGWDSLALSGIPGVVLAGALVVMGRDLPALALGDDRARSLGVRADLSRTAILLTAVALLAVATASVGPIAFVAFLSGPLALRLVGPGSSPLVPAALVGALLVLASDMIAQFATGTRFPVGVVTGVLGAPYLIWMLVRLNRTGGSA